MKQRRLVQRPGQGGVEERESASDTGQRLRGETDGKRVCPHSMSGMMYLWYANPPIYACRSTSGTSCLTNGSRYEAVFDIQ